MFNAYATAVASDSLGGGYAVRLEEDGEFRIEGRAFLGPTSSLLQAQYAAVLAALRYLKDYGTSEAVLYVDSTPVVNALLGIWSMNEAGSRGLFSGVSQLFNELNELGREVALKSSYEHPEVQGIFQELLIGATYARDEQLTCPFGLAMTVKQGNTQETYPKGYEVLVGVVHQALQSKGIPVGLFPSITDPVLRRALHQNAPASGRMLLRGPHLVAVPRRRGAVLLACVTSFATDSIGALHTVTRRLLANDMLEALNVYQDLGHQVAIVYQAWARGKFQDPGEPEIAYLDDLTFSLALATPPGWGPTSNMDTTKWTPLSVWVEQAT